jgi:hypothetical protein
MRRYLSALRVLLAGTVVALAMTAMAAPAMATWGGGECYAGVESGHCYAITNWYMTESGESVKGAEDIAETSSMNVPGGEGKPRLQNEMWLLFHPSGGWLEIGQTAGNYHGCCSIHPFIAHAEYRNEAGEPVGFQEYEWYELKTEPTNLYRIEDPSANGVWCEYIWNSQVDCKEKPGHWTTYANWLQAGLEAATETHPTNAGSQEVDFIAHNGEHKAWGSTQPVTGYISPGPNSTKELCLKPNGKSNHPGNGEFGTGGC